MRKLPSLELPVVELPMVEPYGAPAWRNCENGDRSASRTMRRAPSTSFRFPLDKRFAKRQGVLLAEAYENNLQRRLLLPKKL